ncbi:MAG: hypothetical protein AB7Y74_15155 [Syntrophorhabdus sp.]
MAFKSMIFMNRGADIIERKKGGGRLVLLGLPFFLVGLFVTQIPFGIIPVELEGGPIVMALLLPLGPLFAVVGFILMLSRSGLAINRRTRVASQWWGLLIPMKKKEYNLDNFEKVRIEFRAGDRHSPDTFLINLCSPGSKNMLNIIYLTNYAMAVNAAEELASFIDKPIENLASNVQDEE